MAEATMTGREGNGAQASCSTSLVAGESILERTVGQGDVWISVAPTADEATRVSAARPGRPPVGARRQGVGGRGVELAGVGAGAADRVACSV